MCCFALYERRAGARRLRFVFCHTYQHRTIQTLRVEAAMPCCCCMLGMLWPPCCVFEDCASWHAFVEELWHRHRLQACQPSGQVVQRLEAAMSSTLPLCPVLLPTQSDAGMSLVSPGSLRLRRHSMRKLDKYAGEPISHSTNCSQCLKHWADQLCDRHGPQAASSQAARLPQMFVPDITLEPGHQVSDAVYHQLRAEAAAMPLWELGLRTALELGVLILAWQAAQWVIRSISRRGKQVS